ncbi:MAG: UDP-2,3-diacylglucosamine diphosphatase [Saprospiraceae bacterium]|nr:UDP-2,3-diacylglucosamine diphosphatase [Saprospiraceae bacterium]
MNKRAIDVVVISDLHLGTFGCHSKELLEYLNSINTKTLILNGDIIDVWNFKKKKFPDEHLLVLSTILSMSQKGTKVYYITGNHDDLLRQFSCSNFGQIQLEDKLILDIGGKRHWFFHGDIFDASIQNARWLAKLGGKGYDLLIWLNRTINKLAKFLGRKPMSFSRKIKENVKKAVKYIHDFEQITVDLAVENNFDYVVCGHIHTACIKKMSHSHDKGSVIYMNSGDWVESLTALEYYNDDWHLFTYDYDVEVPFELLLQSIEIKQTRIETLDLVI